MAKLIGELPRERCAAPWPQLDIDQAGEGVAHSNWLYQFCRNGSFYAAS
jgi:hypothetical protein